MHMYLHLASNSTWLFGYLDFFGTVDGGWSLNHLNPNPMPPLCKLAAAQASLMVVMLNR